MSESPGERADSSTESSSKNVSCPECGESYGSENALNSHIGHSHPGLKRETVSCVVCGAEKDIPKCQHEQSERFFCGSECRGVWVSENNIGGSNPSYSGGEVEIECSYCESGFGVAPSIVEYRNHCSRECYSENRAYEYTGENAPNYKGGKVSIECGTCGDTFGVKRAREDTARFCSYDCMAEVYKETMAGPNSPTYSGGHDPYYGPNWREQRRRARDRDQHRCQGCGATTPALGQEADVHHITPLQHFKDNYEEPGWWERGNNLDNLVTLCRSCHMRREPRHELVGQG